ncbi:lysine biosynthesis protein LysX [Acidianus sp. RZ1]|uniref:lysine biosynthesis protein LysX n=1 Tax=Acidianus sp. RZ1 TaxID=1540082 RepID=UPI0014911C27|nr:lysine biosynthesis protein LysX [Acidianus sp. RZ1]
MIIGLTYDIIRWEEKSIIEEANKLGHKITPIFTKDFYFSSDEYQLATMDVVLQRNTSHARAFSTSTILEGLEYKVINDARTLVNCENKLVTMSLLSRHKIPIPKTAVAFSKEKALEVAGKIGYPTIIKPVEGSWGRMVAKADNDDYLRSYMEYQDYTTLPLRNIYFIQEFVKKPDRDIRIFVIGDEVPVGIYRTNTKNWRTNTALGAVAEPLKIDEELQDLAIKVKDIIGGFFLGIDVFEDPERGYLVDEVNGVPEFKNTVRVNKFNVSEYLIKKVEEWIRK